MWVHQPSDWAPQNLRYAGYSLLEGEGRRVWDECLPLAALLSDSEGGLERPSVESPRWGDPVLVRPRLGQGGFRVAVTDAYQRACAVTSEHSLPALEAAHIRPYGQGGEHAVSNGLLLRSDLHRLFDRGYVTVTPEHRLEVSSRLKDHFSNGRSYYPLHGSAIVVPKQAEHRPDAETLRWHNEQVFRG